MLVKRTPCNLQNNSPRTTEYPDIRTRDTNWRDFRNHCCEDSFLPVSYAPAISYQIHGRLCFTVIYTTCLRWQKARPPEANNPSNWLCEVSTFFFAFVTAVGYPHGREVKNEMIKFRSRVSRATIQWSVKDLTTRSREVSERLRLTVKMSVSW